MVIYPYEKKLLQALKVFVPDLTGNQIQTGGHRFLGASFEDPWKNEKLLLLRLERSELATSLVWEISNYLRTSCQNI